MEEKKVKLILNKSGNGNINPRIPIPFSWFKQMGLDENNYEVNIMIDENNRLIVKKTK